MSQNSSDNDNTADETSTEDFIEVRSPYRPYPLGAKKELRRVVETVEFPDDDSRCAYVSEIPPESTLEEYELSVIRTDDPDEVWETERGTTIEIFADRVEHDGREMDISPAEASEKAAEQDHFTRVDTDDADK